jgi:hypothetical protein
VDVDRVDVIARLEESGAALGNVSVEGADLRFPLKVNFVSGNATAAGTALQVTASGTWRGEAVATASGNVALAEASGASLKLTLVASHPPVQPEVNEVCDNGVDDDADGAADCLDTECEARGCHAGGLTCISGRCSCAGGVVGVSVESAGTFLPRLDPRAVVLADGTLATVGGRDTSGATVGTVEFFADGALTTRQLAAARTDFSVVALSDGGMVVSGGTSPEGTAVGTVELMQAARDFSSATVSPSLEASGTGAVELAGALVLTGGTQVVTPGQPAEGARWVRLELSGTPGTRSESGLMSSPHGHTAVQLGGEVLAVGGPVGAATSVTDLVSPDGTSRPGPGLPVALVEPAAVRLADGQVLVVGGLTAQGAPSARAFLFRARAGAMEVREVAPMQVAKGKPRVARASSGWVYVDDATGFAAAPEWFDPVAERFVPGNVPERRGYAVAGPYSSGVALAGGGPAGTPDGKVLVLTPSCPQ